MTAEIKKPKRLEATDYYITLVPTKKVPIRNVPDQILDRALPVWLDYIEAGRESK